MAPRFASSLVTAATVAVAFLPTASVAASGWSGAAGIVHEPLPYAPDALEPHMSAETFSYHHGKHYLKYVNTANAMIESLAADETIDLTGKSAEEVLLSAHERGDQGLFNNAAQAYNHAFFFRCMKPGGGGVPADNELADMIDRDFGEFSAFKSEFAAAAIGAFGSGWAWLCLDGGGKLVVTKTIGAGNPLTEGLKPILTVDVWEHAYYIDYRNARDAFVSVFLDKLVDWDFVNSNLEGALSHKGEL